MASSSSGAQNGFPHRQQQPPPFTDFQFSFDAASLFPEPPPVPPSASSELFSANETSDLFGFLDNFNWEFDPDPLGNPFSGVEAIASRYYGNYSGDPSGSSPAGASAIASVEADLEHASRQPRALSHPYQHQTHHRSTSPTSQSSLDPSNSSHILTSPTTTDAAAAAALRAKPLLSDPQKRINHIMSEQKRRNAIRDGYAQLTSLIAPAGAPPGTGMPTRGRPKGSGARGKGRPGAGKSGVLLRAVEYIRWLEEGTDALRDEVLCLEAAAGIAVDARQ